VEVDRLRVRGAADRRLWAFNRRALEKGELTDWRGVSSIIIRDIRRYGDSVVSSLRLARHRCRLPQPLTECPTTTLPAPPAMALRYMGARTRRAVKGPRQPASSIDRDCEAAALRIVIRFGGRCSVRTVRSEERDLSRPPTTRIDQFGRIF
jgi:hypothetical protein